ncbi:MAG: hypothetical protein ACTJHU_06940 [Mycetocola sp.]
MSDSVQRNEFVSQTTHSALLEGLMVSQTFTEDSKGYVAGTLSADELVALTQERLGLRRSV